MQGDPGMATMKHISTWLALVEIFLTVFVLLSVASILAYAPFWILGGLIRSFRRPMERNIRLFPLVAALSLIGFVVICMLASNDLIFRMGNLSGWSFSLFLATIAFAIASAASTVALWCTPKQRVRRLIRIYSIIVSIALVMATAYFLYWGIIGLCTWA